MSHVKGNLVSVILIFKGTDSFVSMRWTGVFTVTCWMVAYGWILCFGLYCVFSSAEWITCLCGWRAASSASLSVWTNTNHTAFTSIRTLPLHLSPKVKCCQKYLHADLFKYAAQKKKKNTAPIIRLGLHWASPAPNEGLPVFFPGRSTGDDSRREWAQPAPRVACQ